MNVVTRILLGSRYFILIAVFGSLLASIAAIVYSSLIAFRAFLGAFQAVLDQTVSDEGAHHLAVGVINSVDIMLLGTVLYLIAFGLYDLFLDPSIELPSWMKVHDIDQLKGRLLSVVVVMIAVNFLAHLVEPSSANDLLAVGLAVGAVFLGLGVLTFNSRRED